MREKRRGRSAEESRGGGGAFTQRQTKNIKRESSRDQRQEVQEERRRFNDGNRVSGRRTDKAGELERARESQRQMSPSPAPAD